MKRLALAALLFASSNALAYSHLSTGTGVLCGVSLAVSTPDSVCVPHVVKETRSDTGIININHKHVYNLNRVIDNPSCMLGWASENVRMEADLATAKTGKQILLDAQSSLSAYHQLWTNDVIETAHTVTDISYDILPAAKDAESARLQAVVQKLASTIQISYDISKPELSVQLLDAGQVIQQVANVNYAKGTRASTVRFDVPVAEAQDSTNRIFKATVSCRSL
jgi:hypothetical protein